MFHSVEHAPPAKFFAEMWSGLNEAPPAASPAMSGADVTLRFAASAESPVARRARPKMASQAIENARFAPENGAPFSSPGTTRGSREKVARLPDSIRGTG